jgi:hypothetical protein
MLCLDSKRPFVDLHQLWFFATPSNAKLFQNLLEEDKQKRQPCRFLNIPPFWRHIKAVHFVQFQTLAPEPTMTVQIEKKHSLPYNRRDWKFKGNGIQGPLMAAYMEGPDSASYGWSAYDYIPKRDTALPPQDGCKGWGLYVEEGVSWKWHLAWVNAALSIAVAMRIGAGGPDRSYGASMAGMLVTYMAALVAVILVVCRAEDLTASRSR